MSTKRAKPQPGEATSKDGMAKGAEQRRDTRRRIRKIVARHREAFEKLAG